MLWVEGCLLLESSAQRLGFFKEIVARDHTLIVVMSRDVHTCGKGARSVGLVKCYSHIWDKATVRAHFWGEMCTISRQS